MNNKLTYKAFGERTILIEWPALIEKNILAEILKLKEGIIQRQGKQIQDFVVGYNSLAIIYKEVIEDFTKAIANIQWIDKKAKNHSVSKQRLWEIPVCYEDEFGIDLEDISVKLQLSKNEIIGLHSQSIYTIFFIGFLPGFMYLGGLNEKIHLPRKKIPRLKVPKGSVGIGGSQTGVYPSESAGGWNLIGRSPLSFFNINLANPCFALAGDNIQFVPISKDQFFDLEQKIRAHSYTPKYTWIYD